MCGVVITNLDLDAIFTETTENFPLFNPPLP